MRYPWGFNPPKESFETRTLIGRMWKRSNALSWPILIAREAWSYNLKTWKSCETWKAKREKQIQRLVVVLKHDNVIRPIWFNVNDIGDFTSSNLLQTPHENETAQKHFCWWKLANESKHQWYRLCLAAIAVWTHPFPSRTGPWNEPAPMIVCTSHAKVGHCQAIYLHYKNLPRGGF